VGPAFFHLRRCGRSAAGAPIKDHDPPKRVAILKADAGNHPAAPPKLFPPTPALLILF